MPKLNNCPHCGAETEFIADNQGARASVFARCSGCKIQTQPIASSLEYSAMERVAVTWNANNSQEWPEWVQPKGAHDAYYKDSKVRHKSKNWISNVDANVWEPGVSSWTVQGGGNT